MTKDVLMIRGGWEGHTPVESTDRVAAALRESGCDVKISETLDTYLDGAHLAKADVIVQSVTMSEISGEQWQGLSKAVRAGTGFAGWHGGVIDAFRANTEYQWMTGGQWVAHPGNCIPQYTVEVAKTDHPITRGLRDFVLRDTEQYYVHVDPAIDVLCTTRFDNFHGETELYGKVTMPYAWTRQWGSGRVFIACWGHTFRDFEVPEAVEIVRRGILWAAK